MRILLVEDDLDQVLLEKLAISKAYPEAKIVVAINGATALNIFKNDGIFDLVISDLNLPIMNGKDLLLEIDRIDLLCPLVMISSQSEDTPEAQEVIRNGISFMRKPLGFEELKGLMQSILQKPCLKKSV
jgi:DNA-binding NtrC family response regulator